VPNVTAAPCLWLTSLKNRCDWSINQKILLTGASPEAFSIDDLHVMHPVDTRNFGAEDATATALPLRLLLRFSGAAFELRFVKHYVAFYFRYAQLSLLLGVVLIAGDYLVDRIAHTNAPANLLRLTVAVPVLLMGLGYSLLPKARRHWQPVMASFIVTVALCLMGILVRIDEEGGAGLKSWVGVLNFTFLQFYCFVILGVQFRHALVSGVAIMAAFLYALWGYADLSTQLAGYWSYHVVTVFMLAAGIGWWREFVLRKEFMARAALDDSLVAAEQRALRLAHYGHRIAEPPLVCRVGGASAGAGSAWRCRMRRPACRDRPLRRRQRCLRTGPRRCRADQHRPAAAHMHSRWRRGCGEHGDARFGRGGAPRRQRLFSLHRQSRRSRTCVGGRKASTCGRGTAHRR